MPVFRLPRQPVFPDPALAEPGGLLAVGGDLSTRRLLAAYSNGIFPWFSDGDPLLWWSPDPRMVLDPAQFHLPRSLAKTIRKGRFTLTADTAFERVIAACSEAPRPGQDGTWITDEMAAAYVALHKAGHAHSFEAWEQGVLVGGLYGVSIGGYFAGESMFAKRSDASKVAFAESVRWMGHCGCPLIDCQLHTEHLERFGAKEMSRRRFRAALATAMGTEALPRGQWTEPFAAFLAAR